MRNVGIRGGGSATANFGLDVHIDTGLLGLSQGGILSAVQDFFITPLWMAVVWVVHAIVVMLEWCFTIDLLDSAAAGGVGAGLRQMQSQVTDPWLAIVFSLASVIALYNGLIRRRVAETLGQAVLMLAMTLGGLWVIADPTGTVGAVGRWANQASVGTLAVAAQGNPARSGGALAHSMSTVFAAAVEAPWCYLEFGDVTWCRSPAELDPRLRAAGLRIAGEELSATSCDREGLVPCAGSGDALAALRSSAALLRGARSNGAIFLALPANGPARNSINDEGSLLRTICQSSDATNCLGPAAAPAEFRTNDGTWSRVGGLLLIVVGVLGTVLLLGFIAVRLLAAALFSLLYLLLAPAMVLAPALGESGRAVFRAWGMRLLGALVAKLVFAFLLGAVLAVLAILSGLQALGWWTQWLLTSAFTWGAYTRRHQALGLAGTVLMREQRQPPRSVTRRASDLLESRKALMAGRWARGKLARSDSKATNHPARAQHIWRRARGLADEQARRTLDVDRQELRARSQDAPRLRKSISARRAQLERIGSERTKAIADGDSRRAIELAHRATRVEEQVERDQGQLNDAAHAPRKVTDTNSSDRVRERARFLDEQAALPPAAQIWPRSAGGAVGEGRDYPALAGLARYGREGYERLDPSRQRAARLEIDRELALRHELGHTARAVAEPSPGRTGRTERKAERDFDKALDRRMQDGGHTLPGSRARRGPGVTPGEPQRRERSSVMADAREVEARRKRQLGWDRE